MTMDAFKYKACLGNYMFSGTRGDVVKVGDPIKIVETGPMMDSVPRNA
jgi:hypothetical protein